VQRRDGELYKFSGILLGLRVTFNKVLRDSKLDSKVSYKIHLSHLPIISIWVGVVTL